MIKEVAVTRQDFRTYSKFACSRLTAPENRGWKPLALNTTMWFVIAFVLVAVFRSTDFSLSLFHWPTAVATAVPFVVLIIAFVANLRRLEKSSIPKENGLMLGKRTIEIDESGIKDSSALGTSAYKWQAVEEIVEHEGNVYLFLDAIQAQVIPASSFSNREEVEDFVKHVKEIHSRITSDSPG